MATRKYIINKTWEGDYGEDIHFEGIIELDNEVIKVVDDEWRSKFYNLITPQDIAEHIAFNIVVNHLELPMLDGFADLPIYYAKIIK